MSRAGCWPSATSISWTGRKKLIPNASNYGKKSIARFFNQLRPDRCCLVSTPVTIPCGTDFEKYLGSRPRGCSSNSGWSGPRNYCGPAIFQSKRSPRNLAIRDNTILLGRFTSPSAPVQANGKWAPTELNRQAREMGISFNHWKVLPIRFRYIPEMRNTFPDMVKTFTPVKAKQETECVLLQAN